MVVDSTSAPNYEQWQTNTRGTEDDIIPTYTIYFFDIQNPDGIINGEKPVVVEVGPYAFNEYYFKFDIEWTDGGDTVTYNSQRYYVFDPTKSGPGLTADDSVLVPYAAVIGFSHVLDKIPPEAQAALDSVLLDQIDTAQGNVTTLMNQLYVAALLIPGAKNKQAARAQIQSANASLHNLLDHLYDFVNASETSMLMLKTVMCQVPGGIYPFLRAKPGNACKGDFLFSSLSLSLYLYLCCSVCLN
jgi:hypothetical protein